jgi:hypothetical protein
MRPYLRQTIHTMPAPQRFTDQHKTLADFHGEVWVVCPSCSRKAVASADVEAGKARLTCAGCGYHKERDTRIGPSADLIIAAHAYFDVRLWLEAPFREHTFMAYNGRHLDYLEGYIRGTLREHRDREGFTLLEKLPRFYHLAKNREPLLKIVAMLRARR